MKASVMENMFKTLQKVYLYTFLYKKFTFLHIWNFI